MAEPNGMECSICDNVLNTPFHHGREMNVLGDKFVCQLCGFTIELPKCCGTAMAIKSVPVEPVSVQPKPRQPRPQAEEQEDE